MTPSIQQQNADANADAMQYMFSFACAHMHANKQKHVILIMPVKLYVKSQNIFNIHLFFHVTNDCTTSVDKRC